MPGRSRQTLAPLTLAGEAANQSGALRDKFVAWHAAIRIARILRLKPVKEKHFEPAPMLGFDGASRLFGHPTGAAFGILEAVVGANVFTNNEPHRPRKYARVEPCLASMTEP